jgi:serine/threonine protein kinase
MVLDYADGGNINNYSYININWYWFERLEVLNRIILGLKKIHENKMVHRDFHTGNILLSLGSADDRSGNVSSSIHISDMGLCGEVGNIDEKKIYGVMPYVAPEVLRGKPYTQAADIYSFGMIMYFVATKKQPFANLAHDRILALNICNGIRPEINEKEVPKCYVDLMKRCWDSDQFNRPSAIEVHELIELFCNSCSYEMGVKKDKEFEKQFKEAEEYRKANYLSIGNSQLTNHHPQAYYTSRLLNPFTKDLPKYDDINNKNSVNIVDSMGYVKSIFIYFFI